MRLERCVFFCSMLFCIYLLSGDEDGATVTALPPAVVAGAVEDATAACSSLAALPSTSSAMTEDVETALAAGGLTSITGLSRYAGKLTASSA